jgi:hypothetical protein
VNLEEARKKVADFVCSDCILQWNCSNLGKRMDFGASKPCRFKRKTPGKRNVERESKAV